MSALGFNDGWREGCNDAIGGRPPVYRDGPGWLSRQAVGYEAYARGYIGGYAAKTVTPPIAAPAPEPITLGTLVRQIEKLRITWLLGGGEEEDASAGLDPVAEQHYLLAIGALEQAQRFATLADLHQTRALGGAPGAAEPMIRR